MEKKDLQAKVAFLKGLAEGMEIEDSKQGRLLRGILDALEDFASRINELDQAHRELEEYIEEMDEDLSALEDNIYDGEDEDEDEDEDGDEEKEFVGVKCPHCHQTVYFEEELVGEGEEVTCPNCGVEFVVDENWDYDEEGTLVRSKKEQDQ